jgi:putative ABC transport system permease protein
VSLWKRWTDQIKGRRDDDLDRELAAHLDLEAEEQQEQGLASHEARYAARRAFGNLTLAKEDTRAMWGLSSLERLAQDLRYAGRTLRRSPGFTLVAVITLALGIGANTVIFSVVNTILVRPLPYKDSDRLVRIVENVPGSATMTGLPQRRTWISIERLAELQAQTQTLSQIAGYQSTAMTLTGRNEPIRLAGHRVSPSIFGLLDARAHFGRTLESSDRQQDAAPAVVLSHTCWQRHFGADPGIVGRVLTLDGKGHSVVGIMPRGFEFPDRETEFWIPLSPTMGPGGLVSQTIGRLADGGSLETAAAELNLIYGRTLEAYLTMRQRVDGQAPVGLQPSDPPRLELVGVKDELVAPVRKALLMLLVAVGFVLLIACTNVANLLLARTATRQREMAIRATLGAGRARLIRQMLTESLLLAVVGGVTGSALALVAIETLRRLAPGDFPRLDELGLDTSVFLFTLLVSAITGVSFGLAPALRLSRLDQLQAISEGAASAAAGFGLFRRHRAQSALVVGQVGMAMVLLVGAGLLIHSFAKLTHVSPGFDPSNLLTFQVALPASRDPDPERFAEELIEGLESLPGADAAGATTILPLGHSGPTPMMAIRGLPVQLSLEEPPSPRIVSQDYLRAMGIRVLDGRGFSETDRAGQPRVVLLNQAMAERYYPGENPIGKKVYLAGPEDPGWEIVGVVDNVRQSGLTVEPQPELYIELRQRPDMMAAMLSNRFGGLFFALRTHGDPMYIVSIVRVLVRQIDPEATLELNVASMEQRLSDSVARPRLYTVLLVIFAGAAGILAAVGIYGIVAYAVTQRTREIGIRMALGARGGEVLTLVVKQGMAVVVIGIAVGLAGAMAVTRYLEAMLFGLSPLDATTFAAVSLAFLTTAVLACYLPARRAARVDPMVALRHE